MWASLRHDNARAENGSRSSAFPPKYVSKLISNYFFVLNKKDI